MANLFFDDFNRANEGIDASADWTERYGDWSIVSNLVELDGVLGSGQRVAHIASSKITTADYEVTLDTDRGTGVGYQYIGICGRRVDFSTTDSDMYVCLWSLTDNFVVYKRVSGSWTLIQRYTVTLTTNTVYEFRLKMNGTTIEGYLDGTLRASGTDSALSASGDAGLSAGTDGTANDGRSWDNFSVDDLVAGGGRIMGSLANKGGLAGHGGIAGIGGGLAS